MKIRRHVGQNLRLNDRLKLFSDQLRSAAGKHQPGFEQDALLKRARIAHTAANINEWANSLGLRPPK